MISSHANHDERLRPQGRGLGSTGGRLTRLESLSPVIIIIIIVIIIITPILTIIIIIRGGQPPSRWRNISSDNRLCGCSRARAGDR